MDLTGLEVPSMHRIPLLQLSPAVFFSDAIAVSALSPSPRIFTGAWLRVIGYSRRLPLVIHVKQGVSKGKKENSEAFSSNRVIIVLRRIGVISSTCLSFSHTAARSFRVFRRQDSDTGINTHLFDSHFLSLSRNMKIGGSKGDNVTRDRRTVLR